MKFSLKKVDTKSKARLGEIKTERGKLTDVQQNWLQKVKSSGGIVGIARTVKDALQILKV